MAKNEEKSKLIKQLQQDIAAYNINIQRVLGAKTYAEALLASLTKKEEKKDAIQKSGKDSLS